MIKLTYYNDIMNSKLLFLEQDYIPANDIEARFMKSKKGNKEISL